MGKQRGDAVSYQRGATSDANSPGHRENNLIAQITIFPQKNSSAKTRSGDQRGGISATALA